MYWPLNYAKLSVIYMHKNNCITKENFLQDYQTSKELQTRDDLSIGEDLETFIKRIKNGDLNKKTVPERGESKGRFLLCLMDSEERKNWIEKMTIFGQRFGIMIVEK